MAVKIDSSKCNGCHTCVENCPEDVLFAEAKKAVPLVRYKDECFHCGACIMDCPRECIELDIPLPLRPRFWRVK